MRTFIAIELAPQIKDYLNKLQNQLKTSGADVKWVKPENIHLTLKFLGELDDKKLNKVNEILENISKDTDSFSIRLSSIGAFPKISLPRVIWVGLQKGDNETKQIAEILEKELGKIGIPKENRPYSSHITIARVRSDLKREGLIKELEILTKNFGQETLECGVTKITLFKSTLTPKGPIYEVLREFCLKKIASR